MLCLLFQFSRAVVPKKRKMINREIKSLMDLYKEFMLFVFKRKARQKWSCFETNIYIFSAASKFDRWSDWRNRWPSFHCCRCHISENLDSIWLVVMTGKSIARMFKQNVSYNACSNNKKSFITLYHFLFTNVWYKEKLQAVDEGRWVRFPVLPKIWKKISFMLKRQIYGEKWKSITLTGLNWGWNLNSG